MVAFMWLRQYVDCVVASPGKTMSSYQVDMLDNCGRVYLVFDPDANWMGQSQRAAHKIGKERVRIGSLPAKLDDMIVKYGATSADVWRYIKLARPA